MHYVCIDFNPMAKLAKIVSRAQTGAATQAKGSDLRRTGHFFVCSVLLTSIAEGFLIQSSYENSAVCGLHFSRFNTNHI